MHAIWKRLTAVLVSVVFMATSFPLSATESVQHKRKKRPKQVREEVQSTSATPRSLADPPAPTPAGAADPPNIFNTGIPNVGTGQCFPAPGSPCPGTNPPPPHRQAPPPRRPVKEHKRHHAKKKHHNEGLFGCTLEEHFRKLDKHLIPTPGGGFRILFICTVTCTFKCSKRMGDVINEVHITKSKTTKSLDVPVCEACHELNPAP